MRVRQRWCNSVRWYSVTGVDWCRNGVADDRSSDCMADDWSYRVRYLERLKRNVNDWFEMERWLWVKMQVCVERLTYSVGVGVWRGGWDDSFNNWGTVGNWSNMFHNRRAVHSRSIATENWCRYQWSVSYTNSKRWSVGSMTNSQRWSIASMTDSIWGKWCPIYASWCNSEEQRKHQLCALFVGTEKNDLR